MSQPTTPSVPLKIHQQPDTEPQARLGRGPVRQARTDAAQFVDESGAREIAPSSRYATTPNPCRGCGRPTLGSFGPNGIDGMYWQSVCQSCKDKDDAELRGHVSHTAGVIGRAMEAAFGATPESQRDRQPDMPLVSTGPSGIGGEYQREYTPEAVEALVIAAKGVQDEANRARAEATTGRFGIGPRAIGRIDSALGMFKPLLDRLLGRSGQPKDAASIQLPGELLDESGASAGAGFVPNVGSKIDTTA